MKTNEVLRLKGLKDLLTPEQEMELGALSLNGDVEARNALVEGNIRLVSSYARKYIARQDYDDIVSEGICGLIRAAEMFDPSLGFRFSTYAMTKIMQKVQEHIANERGTRRYAYSYAIRAAAHADEVGVKPSSLSVDEICELFGTTQVRAKTIKAAVINMNRESNDLPKEKVSTETRPDIKAEQNEMIAKVLVAFMTLDKRKQTIIRMRFGIDTEPLTLKKIGKKLMICRERVRQLEQAAIKTMKESLPDDAVD